MPGLHGGGQLFAPFSSHLPPHWDIRIIEYPNDRVLDCEQLTDVAAATIAFGSEPRVVVAESFSGPVALRLATRGNPPLAAIVLIASYVTTPIAAGLRWLLEIGAGMVASVPLPRRRLARFIAGNDPTLCAAVVDAAASLPSRVLAARLRELATVDARADLAACPVPITYIAGEHDRLVTARCVAEFAAHPNTRIVTLPAPHLVLQTVPEAAARVVTEVLTQTSGAI